MHTSEKQPHAMDRTPRRQDRYNEPRYRDTRTNNLRTHMDPRELTSGQLMDIIMEHSEERGRYPLKYRYLRSTGQVLLEYPTFKKLQELQQAEEARIKAEEDKKKQIAEDERRARELEQQQELLRLQGETIKNSLLSVIQTPKPTKSQARRPSTPGHSSSEEERQDRKRKKRIQAPTTPKEDSMAAALAAAMEKQTQAFQQMMEKTLAQVKPTQTPAKTPKSNAPQQSWKDTTMDSVNPLELSEDSNDTEEMLLGIDLDGTEQEYQQPHKTTRKDDRTPATGAPNKAPPRAWITGWKSLITTRTKNARKPEDWGKIMEDICRERRFFTNEDFSTMKKAEATTTLANLLAQWVGKPNRHN